MRFEFIEGVTLADAAVKSYGKTLAEIFENSARGLYSLMTGNTEDCNRHIQVEIELENIDIEMLLYDYLNEFLFYRDVHSLLLFPESVNVKKKGDSWVVSAVMDAERLESREQSLEADVKAVTLHKFSITGGPGEYESLVVYDL